MGRVPPKCFGMRDNKLTMIWGGQTTCLQAKFKTSTNLEQAVDGAVLKYDTEKASHPSAFQTGYEKAADLNCSEVYDATWLAGLNPDDRFCNMKDTCAGHGAHLVTSCSWTGFD